MNRYALLIGINHYAENALGYDPLNGAVHDIERMEAYLKRNFQMSDAQITKLTATSAGVGVLEPTATQPTRANIVRAFRHLINIAQAGDFVYIHYSGHGGRATTCLPEFKGQNELDEGLVPMDIGDQESNYVRDVELTHYCRELVQKGTILTVVLDCCHSGGMDRGLGHAKRRTSRNSEPDRTPRPPSEFDVDRAVLAQYLHSSPNRARNSAFGKGWLPEPEGYTLLAACRSTESAWEGLYDDHTPGGMLTSAWLQALENLGLNQSYQTIYEQVRTEVWRNFPQQTPQLFGEAAREVFSASERKPIFAVSVLKVAPQRLLLDAGQAQGVQNMTQFAIYPSMTEDFTQVATRKAIVTVEQAMATQS